MLDRTRTGNGSRREGDEPNTDDERTLRPRPRSLARGLPEWDLEPPATVLRRGSRQRAR